MTDGSSESVRHYSVKLHKGYGRSCYWSIPNHPQHLIIGRVTKPRSSLNKFIHEKDLQVYGSSSQYISRHHCSLTIYEDHIYMIPGERMGVFFDNNIFIKEPNTEFIKKINHKKEEFVSYKLILRDGDKFHLLNPRKFKIHNKHFFTIQSKVIEPFDTYDFPINRDFQNSPLGTHIFKKTFDNYSDDEENFLIQKKSISNFNPENLQEQKLHLCTWNIGNDPHHQIQNTLFASKIANQLTQLYLEAQEEDAALVVALQELQTHDIENIDSLFRTHRLIETVLHRDAPDLKWVHPWRLDDGKGKTTALIIDSKKLIISDSYMQEIISSESSEFNLSVADLAFKSSPTSKIVIASSYSPTQQHHNHLNYFKETCKWIQYVLYFLMFSQFKK